MEIDSNVLKSLITKQKCKIIFGPPSQECVMKKERKLLAKSLLLKCIAHKMKLLGTFLQHASVGTFLTEKMLAKNSGIITEVRLDVQNKRRHLKRY